MILWFGKALFWFVVVYAALCIALYMSQRSFIYFPDKDFPVLPEEGDAGFIRVDTQDGLTPIGWYSPAKEGRKTILYFHGNAGNIGGRLPLMQAYIDQGYGVLMAEYRGYAGNLGRPSEDGFYADAEAYLEFLRHHEVPAHEIVLYGESIGSGVAVEMAQRHPDVAALLLVTPFTNFADIAKKTYGFVPIEYLLKDRFDNLAKIAGVKVPAYFFIAGRDEIIDASWGDALYDAAGTRKSRVDYPQAGHNTIDISALNNDVLRILGDLP